MGGVCDREGLTYVGAAKDEGREQVQPAEELPGQSNGPDAEEDQLDGRGEHARDVRNGEHGGVVLGNVVSQGRWRRVLGATD